MFTSQNLYFSLPLNLTILITIEIILKVLVTHMFVRV